MCLPFAPFSEPIYSMRALPPWWALPWLLLDSVVLSALRHYQWVMGGQSAPVARQGGRAMSANYRHYLLLPPVSSLRPGPRHSTITGSTWSLHYPQLSPPAPIKHLHVCYSFLCVCVTFSVVCWTGLMVVVHWRAFLESCSLLSFLAFCFPWHVAFSRESLFSCAGKNVFLRFVFIRWLAM